MKNPCTEQLIDAVIANDFNQVTKLLALKLNPNVSLDRARITPLHFAAQNNHTEIARLLIAAGANPNAKTHPEGSTPLDIAMLHKHLSMIKLLS